MRETLAKAAAALTKRRAEDKRRAQKIEEKNKRKQQTRWKEKLEEYRKNPQRKR